MHWPWKGLLHWLHSSRRAPRCFFPFQSVHQVPSSWICGSFSGLAVVVFVSTRVAGGFVAGSESTWSFSVTFRPEQQLPFWLSSLASWKICAYKIVVGSTVGAGGLGALCLIGAYTWRTFVVLYYCCQSRHFGHLPYLDHYSSLSEGSKFKITLPSLLFHARSVKVLCI